jgi:hypothetical protein
VSYNFDKRLKEVIDFTKDNSKIPINYKNGGHQITNLPFFLEFWIGLLNKQKDEILLSKVENIINYIKSNLNNNSNGVSRQRRAK